MGSSFLGAAFFMAQGNSCCVVVWRYLSHQLLKKYAGLLYPNCQLISPKAY